VLQPPDLTTGCRDHSPPSSPPFPRPGKLGRRGQTGRSCSGTRSSLAPCLAPPFQGLLWPLAPARQQPGWLPSLPGACQAGGRDTGGVTRGCSDSSSPSTAPDIASCHGTAAFWGHCIQHTATFTLCLLPCAGMDGVRDTGILPNTPKGCCELHGVPNGTVVQKGPCHRAGLNAPGQLWGEVPESGRVEGGKTHPKPKPWPPSPR